jgi:hypothetical protein
MFTASVVLLISMTGPTSASSRQERHKRKPPLRE